MYIIEVTANRINIANVATTNKGVRVISAYSQPTPVGAVSNGVIKDPASVSQLIKGYFLDNNIRSPKATFVVDSTLIKEKDVVAPDVERSNVVSILEKSIADITAGEEHVVDYMVYDSFLQDKKRFIKCSMYAIPKSFLMDYQSLARDSTIKLESIDIQSNAMSKLWELTEPGIAKGKGETRQKQVKPKKAPKKNKNQDDDDWIQDTDDSDEMQRPAYINQSLQLWVGLYRDCVKLATNAIDGNYYSKISMLDTRVIEGAALGIDGKKQLMLAYSDLIKNFLGHIENTNQQQKIQKICLYGDYEELYTYKDILAQVVQYPVEMLMPPHSITGINQRDYAQFCCVIGSGLRR